MSELQEELVVTPEEQPVATQEAVPESTPLRSPDEVALQVYSNYKPKYNELVTKLSANAMRRLLNKLVEYPLNEKPYNATSQEEQAAFYLGFRLLEAKFAAYFTEMTRQANANLESNQVTEPSTETPVAESQGENNGQA